MQEYVEIPRNKSLRDSRELILNNDKTIASHYSGTSFPTQYLVVGMECYRTDLKAKYRLTKTTPATWEPVLTATEIAKVKVNNAKNADYSTSAGTAKEAERADICIGNAVTATKLQTARTINNVFFDGSGNITVKAEANGGNAKTVDGYSVGNMAGKIPIYSSSGHLVLPSGAEIW